MPDVDLSEIVDLSGLPEATTAASLRYWFDSASDNLYASDLTGGTVSVASLVDGIHVVHYQVVDNNNGARLETYVIAGKRGSGCICINGAAAHLVHVGDTVIIMAYAMMTPEEARIFKPSIIFPENNRI